MGAFTTATTAPGAIVHTDGLLSYLGLPRLGYDHRPRTIASIPKGEHLLIAHARAIGSLNAWMHDTHRCVSPDRYPSFSTSTSRVTTDARTPRFAGFQRVLGLGLDPVTYRQINRSPRLTATWS